MFEKFKGLFQSEKAGNIQGMPSPLLNNGSGGSVAVINTNTPPPLGTSELLRIYSQSPRLRSIVNKVAVSVSKTSWRLFVPRNKSGKAFRNSKVERMLDHKVRHKNIDDMLMNNEIEEISDHPLLEVLSNGNPDLIGNTNLQVIQTHIELIGEGYWLKERNALGTVTQLWSLPPDWIRRLPTRDKPFYQITALKNAGSYIEIPVTEIIFFKDPDPSNPYGRGSGIAKSLADEIEIDEFSSKYLKSFFHNMARPDVIISGDNIGKDDTQRLEEKWLEKHQGFWKRFKPMFLNRKVDVTTLSQSLESMQITELRKHERDAFISIFGAPPEKFGVLSTSNRSTINASDYFWNKDLIQPRMEFLRGVLQYSLVPDFDDRLILDYHSPIMEDEEAQFNVMKAFPFAFEIDEIRRKAKMAPKKKNGDLHAVPLNHKIINLEEFDPDKDNEDAKENDPVVVDEADEEDESKTDEEKKLLENMVKESMKENSSVILKLARKLQESMSRQ